MTFITGTAAAGTTPALSATVPVGVVPGMAALFVFCTSSGTDWDPVPAAAGASFTLIDDRPATNMRVTVWTGTGLTAGDTVSVTATVNTAATMWHLYTDEYTYDVASVSAAVRAGSSSVSLTGSLTPASGQTVVVVGAERTTATGTTVVSAVSNGSETVTQRLFSEETANSCSTYVGTFTASAAASRTVTITYSGGSGNGYGALITATSVVPPTPPAATDFPAEPLAVVVQAKFDGATWTDITPKSLTRDPIEVTRGKANEQSKAEPSALKVMLNNRDGRYSPRNPAGPHYGLIGRNTELRAGIAETATWLEVLTPDAAALASGQYVSTPDAASLDITGDLDLRFDADFSSWRRVTEMVSKYTQSGDQRSYLFTVLANGHLNLAWSSSGAVGTVINAESTMPVPITFGRITVRATLDVNNGAGGNTVTFYTSTGGVAGTFTQLGDPVITSGTTSIFASTAILAVGDNPNSNSGLQFTPGRVYAAQVRNGIGGTVVAYPDFTAQTAGATSFADTATPSKTWTLTGVSLTNIDIRGHGEVPAWPTKWDTSGNDVWTPVEAAGITRRLGQGAPALRSPMYRGTTSAERTDLVAYWPAEDTDGADSIASGLLNGRPMTIGDDDNTAFASFSGFPGSEPIPVLGDKSIWNGSIRSYSGGSGTVQMWWVMSVPTGGLLDNQSIIAISTTGTAGRWQVKYRTGFGGLFQVLAYDADGALVFTSGTLSFALDGRTIKCGLNLAQSGSNISVDVQTLDPGSSVGSTVNFSVTGRTISKATQVTVSPGAGLPDLAIGQVSVNKSIRSLFDGGSELNGWRGERMGPRMQRLCAEEGAPFAWRGDLTDTVVGGAQKAVGLLDLLQESADADGGVLAESRHELSVLYVPRSASQAQASAVALGYGVMNDLEPIDDDQSVTNDVTVQRVDGSSARAELTTGDLSTAKPPSGIGRYESSQTLNLGYDTQLPDAANWALHMGTVDEARYPTIGVWLEHEDIAGDPTVRDGLHRLELGARLTIDGPMPAWISPDDIDQVVIGTVEVLGVYEHGISMNCVPYRPFRVGTYNDGGVSRYDTGGSTLGVGVSTTATSLTIATTTGNLWTVDPTSVPFDGKLGPELVTVTAISGTTSPQTFTVVRSVNGVVKTHTVGTTFGLADPVYYGLP